MVHDKLCTKNREGLRHSHSCTAYRVFHCYYDDRDGKLVGRLKKKQKDDESDDDKPLLGKPMKEGACSKFKPERSKRMSFEDSGPALLERGHSCRLRQTDGKRGHPEHEGEQARRIKPTPRQAPYCC